MKEFFVKTFLVICSLLVPIQPMIISTGVIVFLDMILGIWAAKKRNEKITSAGMRRTISKMLIFHLSIISGFVVETWLIAGAFPISKLVAGVIGMVEIKSILENANTIYGSDLFKKILSNLGSQNDQK
jgi:hypothetical protein